MDILARCRAEIKAFNQRRKGPKPPVPALVDMALSGIPEMVDYRMAACARLGVLNQMDQFGEPNVYPDNRKVKWDGKYPHTCLERYRDDPYGYGPERERWTDTYTFICDDHGPFKVDNVQNPNEVQCPACLAGPLPE